MEIIISPNAVERSSLIPWDEFLRQTGVHPIQLGELIELGWVAAVQTSRGEYLFELRDVYRIRKFERLCRDFDLPPQGGCILVDLLARIEYLESRTRELERLLGRRV